MDIFTMGFTQKKAEDFFSIIKKNNIEIVVDVRLNNQSQLAGFTKGKDLAYFLKEICNCDYEHNLDCAPTKEILQHYKKNEMLWEDYEQQYNCLLRERKIERSFKNKYSRYSKILLLCSEPKPEYCHRRLLAEYLKEKFKCNIIHI